MKRAGKFWAGLALAGLMLASGWSAEGAQKFRVGIHRALFGSFEVVADRMGYWKAEGLDYNVAYFKQGKLMNRAIIQGDLDVGTTGFAPFVTSVSKGAKLTGIAVTTDLCAQQRVMVAKNSPIKSIKDLKGKTFATLIGTSVDQSFRTYVLPRHGLTEKDLKWLNVVTTDRVAALVSGNADAALVGDPQAEIAAQKGLVRDIEDLCAYDRPRMMHIGNPQTIKANPDQYVKYFRGWLKAMQLLKSDPEKFAKVYHEALTEVGDKTEYSVVLATLKRLTTTPEFNDEIRKNLTEIAAMQKKLGWIKNPPNFSKGAAMDDSMLKKASTASAN
ncbi:MAG: ABC transporter substrate-binding protein [Candidatus Tectomicrobia bacterium]|uniref:ABC transporter substrate-binding protein n=1 Tax=Tectimicrobiota bacterium TaxID=2528274 RepID=A0A932MPV6_UNCTE|nr:ABC transporter substrate-binding protein [Candidatus Tectomicrobia bacterium]